MKRQTLVVVYGGTQLTPPQQAMARALGREIVIADAGEHGRELVLVTGGFKVYARKPRSVSTDWAAASAAEAVLRKRGVDVESRLQTWLPDPRHDRKKEGVRRFRLGLVKQVPGTTARVRRFRIVQDADVIVTIHGEGNTEMVLDLADVVQKPALPLPFTGSDSLAGWQTTRAHIRHRFRLDEGTMRKLRSFPLNKATDAEVRAMAQRIVRDILPRAVRRSCLVLMPFKDELKPFYKDVIEPAIERGGFDPIRIDFSIETGDIYDQFVRLLEKVDAVIVDITGANPNVMYELGHAHARRIEPLLIRHGLLGSAAAQPLPFYMLPQKIELVAVDRPSQLTHLAQRIGEYLDAVRLNKR